MTAVRGARAWGTVCFVGEGGSVTIKVEAAPDRVIVSVIDTGIGISKEDLPRVWERFFQTKEAMGMRKAGFGLGRVLVKKQLAAQPVQFGGEDPGGAGFQVHRKNHSLRSASTGFIRAARHAGTNPATTPVNSDTVSASPAMT